MLIMLPRLALVVVRMYFSVLAKVRRPSSMPRADHVEVALEQHEVGGLPRDVDGLFDRQAGVGRVHAPARRSRRRRGSRPRGRSSAAHG